jgi:gluconate 2-dehydrogenase alpha chain
MAIEKTDVVIVGMGAVGGVMAAELGKAGLKVIGLERGPRLKTADFQLDELRYYQRKDLRPNVKTQPVTWRPNASTAAMKLSQLDYGMQAGGGTVHYGAVSWRLHEDDFKARTQTIERYGLAALPEGSTLADWPLSYAELEPYYDRVEYDIGVAGQAGNLQGRKIDGGNPFEASRERGYPLPPLTKDQPSILFEEGAKKLGYHPFSTPHAILSQPYKGRPACTYCTFCQAYGCYIGAKSSILVTKLPEADATGNVTIKTGAMCYRINSSGKRATGVSYYGPDGSDNTIEADIVVLGTFIYDNTRLLLLSKTDAFPDGLANSSGQVGRHLMSHLMPNVFVGFDDRHVNTYMGPSAQKYTVDDFDADNFDHGGLGFIRGAQISVGTPNLQGGPIAFATFPTPPGVPRWGAAYRDYLEKYFSRFTVMVAQSETLPYAGQMIDLDPTVRDQWGLPAPRLTYDWRRPNEQKLIDFMMTKMEAIGRAMGANMVWRAPLSAGQPGAHHEGGTRMGNDPNTSVVNKYGQSWDMHNLFIVGSSTFPSMSGFNPTLTIEALAYMSADAIAGKYRKSPGPLL